jgi:serine/threonine-protein kinase
MIASTQAPANAPVTHFRREPASPDSAAPTGALPPDMLEEIRRRIGLFALLLLIAFSIDVIAAGTIWVWSVIGHTPTPDDAKPLAVTAINLAAVIASAWLWRIARSPRIAPGTLHNLGLVYQVVVCFTVSVLSQWDSFRDHGRLTGLTWAPALILFFPLIVPGPPRRMRAAAVLSAAMSPLAVWVLSRTGHVVARGGDYVECTMPAVLAVGAAYAGARVVYGLGRKVAAARELGSYRLERQLGGGGMGEVWLARHRMLARPAAVKIIRRQLAGVERAGMSAEARERFEREAQAIAGLRSPHTVTLFDFGVADDGSFYYAMELLDGFDADALVRRFGPVPPERAIHVLRQACHSLSEAASSGLIHRDVKPANLFLCRYGEDVDFVKVLDFGLVKAAHDPVESAPALTRENVVHGTPAFIAPEQALGVPIDHRVDLYALGCVAYWLLTGRPVFDGETAMALLHQHIGAAPSPPSAKSPHPIPEALDGLILECLAKKPADRPDSPRELARRLDAIEGAHAWTQDRARAWWQAHAPAPSVAREIGHPASPISSPLTTG